MRGLPSFATLSSFFDGLHALRAHGRRGGLGSPFVVVPLFAVQAVAALYFVSGILAALLGIALPPIDWQLREMLEIGAALALLVGLVFGAHVLLTLRREAHVAREGLRRASTAFADLLEERFDEWHLTPAERDVALFAIKGLSLAEIARLRETSEGTVKAQTAAIYRKAGVSARSQLVSLFIEDLMSVPEERAEADRASPPRVAPSPGTGAVSRAAALAESTGTARALTKSATKNPGREASAAPKRRKRRSATSTEVEGTPQHDEAVVPGRLH
ncbi:helix-turn-helix transcriptional regulator [Rhodobacter maris]|uniref:Regulatory LuxR family protein n=1 Tax=Rhodobacter maris TaxID=446682 RepID=A0A285RFT1_9RHOB|nr:LuxR C-terminal-related transcriptional regulator [Rhodobacter maris]SOB92588.1 regulatory LuxR family protein [Rhodobacter maris]